MSCILTHLQATKFKFCVVWIWISYNYYHYFNYCYYLIIMMMMIIIIIFLSFLLKPMANLHGQTCLKMDEYSVYCTDNQRKDLRNLATPIHYDHEATWFSLCLILRLSLGHLFHCYRLAFVFYDNFTSRNVATGKGTYSCPSGVTWDPMNMQNARMEKLLFECINNKTLLPRLKSYSYI